MLRRLLTIGTLAAFTAATGCSILGDGDKVSSSQSRDEKTPDPSKVKSAPAPRINPMTHMAAGQMLERQGDLHGAIAQYEKVVAANPKRSLGYNRLGITYQKMGALGEAEQMFKRGLEVDPLSTTLHNNLGYCLLTQQRFADAEGEFKRAIELSPKFTRAAMNLGIAIARQGRLEDSFAQFSKVVPRDVARVNVAVICLQNGDYAAGEKCLREALAINPDCPGAKEQLSRVTQLANSKEPSPPPVTPTPAPIPTTEEKPAKPSLRVAGSAEEEQREKEEE